MCYNQHKINQANRNQKKKLKKELIIMKKIMLLLAVLIILIGMIIYMSLPCWASEELGIHGEINFTI